MELLLYSRSMNTPHLRHVPSLDARGNSHNEIQRYQPTSGSCGTRNGYNSSIITLTLTLRANVGGRGRHIRSERPTPPPSARSCTSCSHEIVRWISTDHGRPTATLLVYCDEPKVMARGRSYDVIQQTALKLTCVYHTHHHFALKGSLFFFFSHVYSSATVFSR